jgi:hypothetical protein
MAMLRTMDSALILVTDTMDSHTKKSFFSCFYNYHPWGEVFLKNINLMLFRNSEYPFNYFYPQCPNTIKM